MKISQVAAQLYTCARLIKDVDGIKQTLKRVSEVGYEAVQVSAMGPIAEEELNQILEGEGLKCVATHEPSDVILNETEKVIERLDKLNCKLTAYPYPADVDLASIDSVKKLAEGLNKAGEKMAAAGQILTYHNHHQEFRRVEGRLILDILFEETDPRYLQGEPDTHWVAAGGGDNLEWCRKLKGRLPMIHLKDYGIDHENQREILPVGEGNLNFQAIVQEAEEAGCEWFIVEHDNPPMDPVESLAMSFNYLKENVCT